MKVKLPPKINVGGNKLEIDFPNTLDSNQLGQCCIAEGFIAIARGYNSDRGYVTQSASSKENTFYHELTHAILGTMYKTDLNADEEFVCVFSSLLCQTMQQIVEIEFEN